ncbi:hypothetical protein [Flyfo siphovirus Tbat2_3]|nr:hypothetical protein [Flyfo siphovirus Tbat2_3]
MKTGGPAFPNVPDGAGDKWNDWDMGMTLRDYFAAKAMQAMIEAHESVGVIPRYAYEIADAMLEAREGE